MSRFDIPQDWSAEQALAVWEFLDEVTRRVWECYEPQIVEYLKNDHYKEIDSRPVTADPDDPIPF